MPSKFPCTQCGLCCRNVHLAEQTKYLDRGDGTCRHYSETDKNCQIYESRPEICRVDLQYKNHYADRLSWNSFVELNLEVCKILQNQTNSVAESDQQTP